MRRNIAEVRRNGALWPVAEPDRPGEYGTPLAWGRGTHQSERWVLPLRCSAPGRFSKGGRRKGLCQAVRTTLQGALARRGRSLIRTPEVPIGRTGRGGRGRIPGAASGAYQDDG